LAEDSSAVYAPGISGGGGHLLFRKRDNTLMAQPFDPERLQITAEALPIAEQVGISGGVLGFGAFSVSQSGVLAYQAGAARNRRFTWVDRTGKRVGVVPTPSPSNWPAMSPDEKTVVFTIDAFNGSRDLWLQDLKHGDISRFTFVAGASL